MIYLIFTMMTIFIISILYKFLETRKLLNLSKYLITTDLVSGYATRKISVYTVHIFAHSNVIDFNVITNESCKVGSWRMCNNKILNVDIQSIYFKDFIAHIRKLMYNL